MRAILIALLSGMLIGGGGVGVLAYIVIRSNNDRLLILETDTHKITHDFDLGMKMVSDGERRAERATLTTLSTYERQINR